MLALLERLYAAALDDGEWSRGLGELATLVGGTGTLAFVGETASRRILRYDTSGLDLEAAAAYDRHWVQHDPRWPAAEAVPDNVAFTEETVLDRRAFRASPIYNEFLRPADVPHILAGYGLRDARVSAFFSVQGSARRGAFTAAERALYSRLLPHLRRVLTLKLELGARAAVAEQLAGFADTLAVGTLLVALDGRIAYVSAAARALLARRDGLVERDGRLGCTTQPADRRLAAVLEACRTGSAAPGGSVRVPRAHGPPLVVDVHPRRGERAGWVFDGADALVVVRDAETRAPPAERLRARFGITEAEAQLVARLADGATLYAAAAALRRSRETARSQLKSVFAKTGCRRQAELLRRVWALEPRPAGLGAR